ncbi:agamous-like MADS-box protein AGL29 [Rosa rugosa]|uniref:agamous-like MADS-box protein AGL29 n=1 Tax=Rosa rugosa TaxID=74645 RepID=UPI002B4112FE|nr:agamous-like MADS-box protein AGL29 [Rosa rugosa]
MEGRKTRGRQKIEIKKIANADDRHVTFSKRRSGIYKKCNELATLCGAEVGVVVFSESEKPFSYGNPSIESIADRFLNLQPPQENSDDRIAGSLVGAYKRARYMEILNKHNELEDKLRDEQLREKVLLQKERARASAEQEGLGWWQRPIKELDSEELKQMYASFQNLHNSLSNHLVHLNVATHNVNNNNNIINMQ